MRDLIIILIILLVLLLLISTFGGSIRFDNNSNEAVGIEKYESNKNTDFLIDPKDFIKEEITTALLPNKTIDNFTNDSEKKIETVDPYDIDFAGFAPIQN